MSSQEGSVVLKLLLGFVFAIVCWVDVEVLKRQHSF